MIEITDSELRLMAGEMTAQELRTVRASLAGLEARDPHRRRGDAVYAIEHIDPE